MSALRLEPIEPATLLRFGRTSLERALVEAFDTFRERRLEEAGQQALSEDDRLAVLTEVRAVTASPAPLLRTTGATAEVTQADRFAGLAGGGALYLDGADQWSDRVARWTDQLTLATSAAITVEIIHVVTEASLPLSHGTEMHLEVLGGSIAIAGGEHRPGDLVVIEHVERGDAVVTAIEPAWLLAATLRRPGAGDVVEAVRRRAGFEPWWRADLPLTPLGSEVTVAPYDGSLLASPDSMASSASALLDEVLASGLADAWWAASLHPRRRLAIGDPRLANLVARPAFLDDRVARPPGALAVATGGRVFGMDLEQADDLIASLQDGSEVGPWAEPLGSVGLVAGR